MFKVYLDEEDFKDFKEGLFCRTKKYFRSIINNLETDLDQSEYEYFYSFILPTLIEIDYYYFTSARSIFRGKFIKDPLTEDLKNIFKSACKKVINILNKINFRNNHDVKAELIKFYYRNNIDENKIMSLSYFYRHKEYLNQIINLQPIIEIDYLGINKISKKFDGYLYKKGYLKTHTNNFYVEQLTDKINFFINYRKFIFFPSKLLLFSNHGWSNSNFSTLLISYVSTKTNKPIIALQAGFNHQSSICIGQVIWERYVCSKYASWTDPIDDKDFKIGTMYANKSFQKNNINNETLVLPQVPFSNVPRCFSSYWTLTINDFNSQISLLEDYIDNILCISKSPVFRIKHCDLLYYSKTIFNKFKKVKVDYGDVNKSQHFKTSKKNFIFYMSTAIIQSVNAGSETFGVFSPKETLLVDNFKKYIVKDYPFECTELSKKLCYCPSIKEYNDSLSNLINKLLKF